jgi:hypothetical protein
VRDDAEAWAGEPFAEQGELPSIRVGSFHRNNLTRYIAVKGRSSRFRRIRRLAGSSAGSPARVAGEWHGSLFEQDSASLQMRLSVIGTAVAVAVFPQATGF